MSDYSGLKLLKLWAQVSPPSLSSFPLVWAVMPESLTALDVRSLEIKDSAVKAASVSSRTSIKPHPDDFWAQRKLDSPPCCLKPPVQGPHRTLHFFLQSGNGNLQSGAGSQRQWTNHHTEVASCTLGKLSIGMHSMITLFGELIYASQILMLNINTL